MALVLGTSYREFESRHPDHFIGHIMRRDLWTILFQTQVPLIYAIAVYVALVLVIVAVAT